MTYGTWSKRIITAITGLFTAVADFVGITGAPKPAKTVQIGGSDGTNLVSLNVNSDGKLVVILESAINTTDNVIRAEVLSTTPPTPTDPAAWTQLTAPGYTNAEDVEDNLSHTIQYVVAAINTNVVVRAEGSLDDNPDPATGNWFVAVADVTITANGAYHLTTTTRMKWIRFRFVSESGGTAATIGARLFSGR